MTGKSCFLTIVSSFLFFVFFCFCLTYGRYCVCVCVKKIQNAPRPSEHPPVRGKMCQNVYMGCVVIPSILDVRLVDAPAGVTQEEGHTGFLHLPFAVLALIFTV